jgi:hypothetical protein
LFPGDPLHVTLGFGLSGLSNLIGHLGADLVIEQVLKGEARAR